MSRLASIFISYSHADKALAQALATELEKRGLRVWIDEGELKIGDSLIERIATAIAEIDFFLALVSQSSAQSNWSRSMPATTSRTANAIGLVSNTTACGGPACR
jgi:TIR domain